MSLLTYICKGILDGHFLQPGFPGSRSVIAKDANKQCKYSRNVGASLTDCKLTTIIPVLLVFTIDVPDKDWKY